jgi:hypothetical protein
MNMTTTNTQQMTTAELNKASNAAEVLCSDEIVPFIADDVLSAKLSSLLMDLRAEQAERPA